MKLPGKQWTLAILVLSAFPHAVSADERPNIIFILADDLGYGELGCYGQRHIQTPRLDRMAAEGMRFTQFYAGSTVCAPSRCVLMTGLHLGHARVRGNGSVAASSLLPEDVTVAELLHQAGYATALCGKWGLGDVGTESFPTDQGFDYFYGYLNQTHAHNYFPEFLWRNRDKVPLRNVVVGSREGPGGFHPGYATTKVDYSHDLIMDEALTWVREQRNGPFFLYVALTIPHANNEGTRGTGNGQEVPDLGAYADQEWNEPDKGQAAMITRMDTDVGRLLDLLDELGIAQNSIVFFSSDNGPHREGGNDHEFFDANGPLRGLKRDLYEGGIRVPFIAWGPGRIAPGAESDHRGYFGDFLQTTCELAQIPPPTEGDGISLVPTLLGRDGQKEHSHLYWEFYEQGSAQAVRFGNWKAVRKPMLTGAVELYDLAADIGERHDVAAAHPGVVRRALEFMEESRTPSATWLAPSELSLENAQN